MSNLIPETICHYPRAWEDEYRRTCKVKQWFDEYPDQFHDWMGSTRPNTLELFAQYCLMFMLRRNDGVSSITWYQIADDPTRSKNRDRTLLAWSIMRTWIGAERLSIFQATLRSNGFHGFAAEPDLFCWSPDTGAWFFAEAKRKDKLSERQIAWMHLCRQVLGEMTDIRVYRVIPE